MKRIGNQEPTVHFALPFSYSEGQKAIDLYELTGQKALEWQKILICDILAQNEEKLWIHTRYGYSVPRQNGKGEILAIRELYGLAMGEKIIHTAHLVNTAHKAYERLCTLLEKLGLVRNQDFTAIKAKGQELIEIPGAGRVEFRTRTATGALGETYDVLIVDEAQEYRDEHQSALQYVISASQNPQTIMCGTPPTAVSTGTVFKEYRADVLSGLAADAGWSEWSVSEYSDPNNKDLWYQTNPSLGIRITERTVASEIGKEEAKIADFNIQRLGLWLRSNLQSAVQKADWDKILLQVLPKLSGKMDIGIKYAKSTETVSMAIAVKTEEGRIFGEVIDSRMVRDGNEWILEFIAAAKDSINKIVVDGESGQKLLQDELKKIRMQCILPTVAQVIKANAAFEQNLFAEKLCRMEQPTLTAIVTNTTKRKIGSHGGFGYDTQFKDADISIMDAFILATWAQEEFPEPKKQKIRF